MKNKKLGEKLIKAMNFLDNHPGINYNYGSFSSEIFVPEIYNCCKRGFYNNLGGELTLLLGDLIENYPDIYERLREKYKDEITEDYDFLDLKSIPYKEAFGEEWQYYKTVYTFEISYFVFDVKLFKRNRNVLDKYAYLQYFITEVEADTFEELILKIEETVKKELGDWSYLDFYTEQEKNEKPFIETRNGRFEFNEDYFIPFYELNRRWYEWYKNERKN